MAHLKPLWDGFTYHEHQIKGIDWMLEKEKVGTVCGEELVRGGFQCDEMGLGKTIQIAGTARNNPKKRTLILAPLAMLETWEDIMLKSGFNVFHIDESKWQLRNTSGLSLKKPSVYVSNYDKLLTSIKPLFLDATWDRVVLDESHKIRNSKSEMTKAVCSIVAPIRWAVTGTPLVNGLGDVASQMHFLGVPKTEDRYWYSSIFNPLIPQLMIHRSIDSLRSVLTSAPPVPTVEEMVLPFTSTEEKHFYRSVQGAIAEKLHNKYAREMLSANDKLLMLMRLRQISVHPQVYIKSLRKEGGYDKPDWKDASAKLITLGNIISDEKDTDHKYLVFCQFKEEMELIKAHLLTIEGAKKVAMYHGGLTSAQRKDVLESTLKDDCNVLLIQLQSGGVGLNLQQFDRCIFMSPWWTSALMEQATARTVRMGQKRIVRIIHLTLSEEKTINIDRLMSAKAESKKAALINLFKLTE